MAAKKPSKKKKPVAKLVVPVPLDQAKAKEVLKAIVLGECIEIPAESGATVKVEVQAPLEVPEHESWWVHFKAWLSGN